jgi:hypothetical protein
MSPERSVLQLRQRAQFVVAPVDAGVGHHQLLPARLDELGRRVGGHLAGVVAVMLRSTSMASSTSLAAGAARNLSTSRNSGA